jgi:hypothetical protein
VGSVIDWFCFTRSRKQQQPLEIVTLRVRTEDMILQVHCLQDDLFHFTNNSFSRYPRTELHGSCVNCGTFNADLQSTIYALKKE